MLDAFPRPQISFNHHSQLLDTTARSEIFERVVMQGHIAQRPGLPGFEIEEGMHMAGSQPIDHHLGIRSYVAAGKLVMDLRFHECAYDRSTMESVGSAAFDSLRQLASRVRADDREFQQQVANPV
jgi:hypothetical protein